LPWSRNPRDPTSARRRWGGRVFLPRSRSACAGHARSRPSTASEQRRTRVRRRDGEPPAARVARCLAADAARTLVESAGL